MASDAAPVLPDLGPLGLARYAWRQLTSMRTALFLLMLLAVAAVPGSIIPQRGIDPSAVRQYLDDHPSAGPWLDRLGFFEVFASPWFSAIYLLLFVSLVGCVLPRTRVHLTAIRARPPRTPQRLDRMPVYRRVEVEQGVLGRRDVVEAAHSVLRRRRYRVDVRGVGADGDALASVSAERGHLRETGNLLFHLSLVGLLVAVAVGSMFGYRGEVILPVGGSFSNTVVGYDSLDPGTRFSPQSLPPFRLTLDSVAVRFEETAGGNQHGAPRDFMAGVSVVDRPGAAPRRTAVKVNEPLSVAGAHVYLSGNGYAPVLTIRDGDGRVAFSGPVPFLPQDGVYTSTGVVKAPDATPEQIGLQGILLPTAVIDPQFGPISIFPDAKNPQLFITAYTGDLGLDDGAAQSVYRLDTTDLTQLTGADGSPFRVALAPGQSADLPGGNGSVTFEELVRFAALDVRHDPGKVPALAFAVLAMLGLVASLFIKRRRIWVRVLPATAGETRTVIEVAALSRGDDPGLGQEAEQVESELLARLDVPGRVDAPVDTIPSGG